MYTELTNTARKICKLAKLREDLSKGTDNDSGYDISYAKDEYTDMIIVLLDALSLSEIVDLQAVMYLGKDGLVCKGQNPETAYENLRDELILTGVKEKEVEILQIAEKSALEKYLTAGYKILGIEL